MIKVLVDRELLEQLRNFTFLHDDGRAGALRGNIDKTLAAQPAEAEWVVFGFDDRSVKVSQEAYSIFLARERHHLAALSAVTAERDRLLSENARLIEDRARFPDRPDDIGHMIGSHIGNLKAGKVQAEKYARKWRDNLDREIRAVDQLRAEVEALRLVAREFAEFFSSDNPRHWELHALADGSAINAKEA